MFWRYNALTSHIDTLLEKEGVTLHELMEEDDILQECKGQNHKLLQFLLNPEIMEELVRLIISEPLADMNDKVKYKYPNIACELLTSDVTQIIDKLTEENVLIDKIYVFILSREPLNPLLSSFYTKVMGLLLARKADYLCEYLQSKDDFFGHVLFHIGTSAIMDLLMRLVTYDPMYETKAKILSWMTQERLIERLVSLIHPSQNEEVNCNAAMTLCDIVRFGREQVGTDSSPQDPLLEQLECESMLTKLLTNMLTGLKSEAVITNGLSVLQTILEYRRQMPEGCVEPIPQHEQERLDKATKVVMACVKPWLPQLTALLTDPPEQRYSSMLTTVGRLEPPLGYTRVQLAKLFAVLFTAEDPELHSQLMEHDVVNKLLDLFFQYTWNNFLHTQVEVCIENIVSKHKSHSDSQEEATLVTHLFKGSRLVERILSAWQENDQGVMKGEHRKGYMGHLTRMANTVTAAMDKGPHALQIAVCMKGVPDGVAVLWPDFVTNQLAEVNRRNTSDLVTNHQLNSSSDSDSDFKDIPFPQDDTAQQAFSDYQMQQLTSTFIDQFGLSEEEFPAPAGRIDAAFTQQISAIDWTSNADEATHKQFETVCELKAPRFHEDDEDSPDEDVDVWKDKEFTFGGTVSPAKPTVTPSDPPDSDSSDEELSSPRIIKSKPLEPNIVSMEIDPISTSDEQLAPVAMDTSPWDTEAQKGASDGEEWTAFESAGADNSAEGWADFSNIEQISREDGGPRVSSPDEEMSEQPSVHSEYCDRDQVATHPQLVDSTGNTGPTEQRAPANCSDNEILAVSMDVTAVDQQPTAENATSGQCDGSLQTVQPAEVDFVVVETIASVAAEDVILGQDESRSSHLQGLNNDEHGSGAGDKELAPSIKLLSPPSSSEGSERQSADSSSEHVALTNGPL